MQFQNPVRTTQFATLDEVHAYVSGDKIQCLLCHRWYDTLNAVHLRSKHDMSADEYHQIFGIPWTIELSTDWFRSIPRLIPRVAPRGFRTWSRTETTDRRKLL